jgi:hypothetical protein
MPDLVCYCFGFSVADVQEDLLRNEGRSSILDRIVAEKKAGTCRCATMHPERR